MYTMHLLFLDVFNKCLFLFSSRIMKVTALALFALVGVIGVALGAGYGYGGYSGGYTYVPATGYGQSAGGVGDGSFCK